MNAKHKQPCDATNSIINTIVRDLIGAILILAITLSDIAMILMPELLKLFAQALNTKDAGTWLLVFLGILITIYLVAFPIFLIVQGYLYYHDARLPAENSGSAMHGNEQWGRNESN